MLLVRSFIIFILFINSLFISAQREEIVIKIDSSINIKDTIYAVVDQSPEFPGGKEGLFNFYKENSRYVIIEKSSKPIYYHIVINKDGSVSNFKIIKGLSKELNSEIIEIVNKMPKWKPGLKNGKPVRTLVTLVVYFE
jgi:protein TonB